MENIEIFKQNAELYPLILGGQHPKAARHLPQSQCIVSLHFC